METGKADEALAAARDAAPHSPLTSADHAVSDGASRKYFSDSVNNDGSAHAAHYFASCTASDGPSYVGPPPHRTALAT